MVLRPIRVVHYGLGAIGCTIARLVAEQRGLQLVGAIDRDPQMLGRDIGEVIGLGRTIGALVSDNAVDVLQQTRPDVVIHATVPRFREVYSQIVECIQARCHVISTCPELVYPYINSPELAAKVDQQAQMSAVTVLGAGVNPGFIMDLLPVIMTAPCTNIRRVDVTRVIDATTRRATFQQRIGAGLMLDQFRDHVARGKVRHVGLPESVYMIADSLGWQLERVSETLDPIIADEWVRTPYLTVAPGQVAGLRQVAQGWLHGQDVVNLSWQASVGARDTHDAIRVSATPPVDLLLRGGLHGDQAAAALVVHAIPRVLATPSGLTTVLALPPIHYQPRLDYPAERAVNAARST